MSGIATLAIVAAVMFCVLGGITLLAHIYNLNSIKSKLSVTVSTVRLVGQQNLKYEKFIVIFHLRLRNGVSRL